MFREMRRGKQQLPLEESLQILKQGTLGILGVQGDDGYPYTVPINYVYIDGKIYFHGARAGHKLDAIRQCDKVSFSVIEKDDIVAEELTTYFRSVILFGRARVLDTEDEMFHAAEVLGLKYLADDERVTQEIKENWNTLCCVEITIEHITGKEAVELTRQRKQ